MPLEIDLSEASVALHRFCIPFQTSTIMYLFVTSDNPDSGGFIHEAPWLHADGAFFYPTESNLLHTKRHLTGPWYTLSGRVLRTGIGHPTVRPGMIHFEVGLREERMNLYPIGDHPKARGPRVPYFTRDRCAADRAAAAADIERLIRMATGIRPQRLKR
jgi:hypothetical protein